MTVAGMQPAAAHNVRRSQHLELSAVAGQPLRSGSVEGAEHGPNDYACERYVLNGAAADAAYEVRVLVHLFDATCSNWPVLFAATRLGTNGAGDGSAQLLVRREDVPAAVRNATHGVHWEVWRDGTLAYRTACTSVTLD